METNSVGERPDYSTTQATLPGTVRDLLPTPVAGDYYSNTNPETRKQRGFGPDLPDVVVNSLLPTPMAHDAKGTGPSAYNRNIPELSQIDCHLPTPLERDWKGGMANQPDLNDAIKMLSTPRSTDRFGLGQHGEGGMDLRTVLDGDGHEARWGKYEPAIRRWENLTRPAPSPIEPNTKGRPRLSAAFSEWMMGWPDGWVTAVPGISRNEQLKIVGNGVCPQQAIVALRELVTGMSPPEVVKEGVLLLPTPVAQQSGKPARRSSTKLLPSPRASDSIEALLPMPRTSDARGVDNPTEWARHSPGLAAMSYHLSQDALLPTPRASDGTNGGPNQRGSSGDLMLPSAVVQNIPLLPTPKASDGVFGTPRTRGRPIEKSTHLQTIVSILSTLSPLQEAFVNMDENQRTDLAEHLDGLASELGRLTSEEIGHIPQGLLSSLVGIVDFCATISA